MFKFVVEHTRTIEGVKEMDSDDFYLLENAKNHLEAILSEYVSLGFEVKERNAEVFDSYIYEISSVNNDDSALLVLASAVMS